MNTRLSQIIQYKTGGRKGAFAKLMGWSPQYLTRLIQGQSSMGIAPVTSLIETLPELDARWLITGEGTMLTPKYAEVLNLALALEKYMPVMSAEEQSQLVSGTLCADPAKLAAWESLLDDRRKHLASIFAEAYERQKAAEQCNTQTANL